MYRDHRVGVVVPAYNEERFVGEVIDTVPEFVDHVYPVDDGSTDDTWREMRARAEPPAEAADASTAELTAEPTAAETTAESTAAEPTAESTAEGSIDGVAMADGAGAVVPLRHETNRGVGAAVKTGYARAVEDDCDVVAVMNGDGQMAPEALSDLLDPIVDGRADYAKGDRLHSRRDCAGMSRWRLFGNSLLTMLTRASSGYWGMTDSQNGYTAISREAIESVPMDDLYDDYGFLNDLLTELNVRELRVADVPHSAVYGEERSDIAYAQFVPSLSGLLARNFCRRLTLRYLVNDFHPAAACYPLGVLGLLAGVGGLAASGLLLGGDATVLGGLLAALLMLLGGFVLAVAVALDVQQNAALEVEP